MYLCTPPPPSSSFTRAEQNVARQSNIDERSKNFFRDAHVCAAPTFLRFVPVNCFKQTQQKKIETYSSEGSHEDFGAFPLNARVFEAGGVSIGTLREVILSNVSIREYLLLYERRRQQRRESTKRCCCGHGGPRKTL